MLRIQTEAALLFCTPLQGYEDTEPRPIPGGWELPPSVFALEKDGRIVEYVWDGAEKPRRSRAGS